MSARAPLLSVRHVKKYFRMRTRLFQPAVYKRAVDDVSFEVPHGQTLALVGESGSGKSTIGLMLLDLLEPTSGDILYEGRPFSARRGRERKALRREMQVVFQDPYASLNARMNVRETLKEGMMVHRLGANAQEREARAAALLRQVSLTPDALERYPHEFSGGQRQRIAIARALSVEPKFLVLDEPTSALDVSSAKPGAESVAATQRDFGLTYLFITHNLMSWAIWRISDMCYGGRQDRRARHSRRDFRQPERGLYPAVAQRHSLTRSRHPGVAGTKPP
jgi:ABC-type microcin C transport system duplicated ATPase subunit YejF